VQIAFSSDLACSKPIKDGWDYSEIGGDGEMWGLTDAQMKAFIQQKFQGFRFEVEEETGIATVVDVDGMEITVYWDEYRTLASLGCGR
jgi:hypothetical protein